MKKFSLLFLALILSVGSMLAQRTVTGTVMDEAGEAVIGANVLAKGTSVGTITDIDGSFSIDVPDGSTMLVVSYTGFETQEVDVSATNNVSITLSEGQLLDEVVVTALGIERSEKALGYAVQEVKADEVTRSGATNAVDALVGKASGVQITRSSGSAGGGSRITIRGVTSMQGNNQPLIVVDGVRINNVTNLSQASTAGTAASNRLMDLNPEDIESVNVLKGAAATALYGTAGSTGVVLITTKKGASGAEQFNVNFTSSVSFDNITQMANLQNTYAQGWRGTHLDPSTGHSTSWGPKVSDLEYSTDPNHPNAPGAAAFNPDGSYRFDKNGFLVPKGTGNGKAANVYDNVNPFFQTGNQFNNSLAIEGGGKTATFRLSLSDLRTTGIIPNEEYDRTTVKVASTIRPTDKLTIAGSANYTKSDYTRIQQGSNVSGLLLGMLRTPVTFDNANGFDPADAVNERSAYWFPDFRQRNYRGGGGYDNPYWTINNAKGFETVDRTFGNVKGDYAVDQWFNVGINVGFDLTSDRRKQDFEIGSRTNTAGTVTHTEFATRQFDYYLTFTGQGALSDDINFNYLAGANAFSFSNGSTATRGDGLVFPGFINLSNATQITAGTGLTRYRTLGFYGQVEAGWNNALYLTLSARQDYDSRLGDPTNFELSKTGFFYPSASLALAFTELMDNTGPLSFGKLRLSYAQVGAGPPAAYSTSSAFESNGISGGWGNGVSFPIYGVTGFEVDNVLGNNELTPELSTTLEAGLDLRFFNDKLGLDATYYRTKSEDAILTASLPASTGYTSVWLNSGKMTSQGIELTLNANPISTASGFDWNTQVNFTKSESIVNELAPGIERLFLAGFSSAGTYLVAGNQYGAIFGGAYLRQDAGTDKDQSLNIPSGPVVINDDPASSEYGYQAVDPVQRAIGNPNPDFIIGWNNSFTYKNFSANFLLDWREGGDLWNGTAWALSFFGRSQLTADTREEAPFAIDGVLSDGTPNNIEIVRDQDYWTSSLGGFGSVGEQFVQDGGWVRLREVGVSYRFKGNSWTKGGTIGLSGRNLWFHSDYDGIDPETSLTSTGNGQGFDYFNMPSTKSIIAKLSINF